MTNFVLNPTVPAQSRRTDPESSRLAASAITFNGKLTGDRAEVYRAICQHPRMTAGELAVILGSDWSNVRVSRRTSDLEHLGLVVKGPIRRCEAKKRQMVTWLKK